MRTRTQLADDVVRAAVKAVRHSSKFSDDEIESLTKNLRTGLAAAFREMARQGWRDVDGRYSDGWADPGDMAKAIAHPETRGEIT